MWQNIFLIATQFVINVQLKDLTHKFFPWISFHKLYNKGVFSCVFTLKYMCQFGMNSKKFNSKNKT
jgi:hypothetical protein